MALARLHGQLAKLLPGQAVLELACGHGAALPIWRDEFGVERIGAMEIRARCVQSLQRDTPAAANPLVQGHFDRPLQGILARQRYDAVLCIDAAYHATSLATFLACACSALDEQGVLVFSTLIDLRGSTSAWHRGILDGALRLAGVPAASLVTKPVLHDLLLQHGLADIEIREVGAHVFAGFHQWVQRRHGELCGRERRSAAWIKIRISAWLCHHVSRHALLDYVLVHARRRDGRTCSEAR